MNYEKDTNNAPVKPCASCGFDLKHPAIPFDCADGKTYCASCFVDNSVMGMGGLAPEEIEKMESDIRSSYRSRFITIGPMTKGEMQKSSSTSDVWFAWFPVRLGALGTGRWVWLQNVWRNKCCGVTIYQSLDV